MSKVALPFVRSAYNYDTMAASDESGLKCEDISLTQQSAKDECDINKIMERAMNGIMPPGSSREPVYGDFTSSADDYHHAMNIVAEAREAFDTLPASVRARFQNDPAEILEFLADGENFDEAVKLGLIEKPPAEDLSTAPPATDKGGKAGGVVEKSDKARKGLFRSNDRPSAPRGYRLVPEGESGDD